MLHKIIKKFAMKTLLFLVTIVCCLKFAFTLDPIPINSMIYVSPGGGYEVGFVKNPEIDGCYYETEYEQKFFKVDPDGNGTVSLERNHDNQIKEMGKMGACRITLLGATRYGPRHWKFVATIKGLNTTYSRFFVNFFEPNRLQVEPSNVFWAVEGSEATFGFKHFFGIKKCIASADELHFEFPVEHQSISSIKTRLRPSTKTNEMFHKGASGHCQILIKNIDRKLPEHWIFIASDGYINMHTEIIQIRISKQEDLGFTPSSGKLYVAKGEDYKLGFTVHGSITICKYNTSKDDFGTFDVNGYNQYAPDMYNGIVTLGHEGVCQILVKSASFHDRAWITLSALNEYTTIATKTVYITVYEPKPLSALEVKIRERNTFMQSFQASSFTPKYCILYCGRDDLDLIVWSSKSIISPKNSSLSKKITPLEGDRCAFKFEDIQLSEVKAFSKWILVATNIFEFSYGSPFDVTVYKNDPRNLIENVYLGSNTTIKCGNLERQELCLLFNPEGQLVEKGKKCEYNLEIVDIEDIGTWRCLSLEEDMLEGLQYETQLQRITKKNKWEVKETFSTIEIDCVQADNRRLYSCRMISPYGDVYFVNDYLATNRITGFKSELQNGICNIQIDKPLESTEEGTWTCELQTYSQTFISAIPINVNNETKVTNYLKSFKQSVRAHEKVFLNCEIPVSSEHCYFLSPSGEPFVNQKYFMPEHGKCSMLVPKTYPHRNGQWTCYFSSSIKGDPDIKIEIEVEVAKTSPSNTSIEVKLGEKLQLVYCSGGEPLSHCTFISPGNKSYHVSIHEKDSNLQHGCCTLDLLETRESHIGSWTCVSKIGFDSSPVTFTSIEVLDGKRKPQQELAESLTMGQSSAGTNFEFTEILGMILGGLIVIFIISLTIYFYRSLRYGIYKQEEVNLSYINYSLND